jgi:UDP-N-acetylglucosamine:LPS N-acetylglucosamine transferase
MKLQSNKLLLVGSSGGHLLQLLTVAQVLEEFDKAWVCFDTPDAKHFLMNENVYWCYHPTTKNVKNMVRNLIQAVRVLIKERPGVILSAGAGVAISYAWVGHFLGAKVVFIEAFNRVKSRSVTGRIVYPIADLFCVQWQSMLKLYPKAKYIGILP